MILKTDVEMGDGESVCVGGVFVGATNDATSIPELRS